MTFTQLKKQLLEIKPKTRKDKIIKTCLWIMASTLVLGFIFSICYTFFAIWSDTINFTGRKIFWTAVVISLMDFAILKSIE